MTQAVAAAPPAKRRRLWWGLAIAAALALALLFSFWRLSGRFQELVFRQPSRLYARIAMIERGARVDLDEIASELEAAGYRPSSAERGALPPGLFRRSGGFLAVHLRRFPRPEGEDPGGLIEIGLTSGRVAVLRRGGAAVAKVALEPPVVASYYGPGLEERRPVRLDRVPQDLIHAVLAAEDLRFFEHAGISVRGVARAAWVNMRKRGISQGGSTLTQQLAKNLYLTHERTVARKVEEAILALLLELRYSKREILEAYLNEIYLGSRDGVNLVGVGAASRAFFGKDPAELDLAESAALAGMIRSPASYSPSAHPERCRERRDFVLDRLAELELAEPERIAAAKRKAVAGQGERIVRRRAAYFAEAMAEEAERRFDLTELADLGFLLFSTLDLGDQRAAERAVRDGLAGLEGAKPERRLESALVSIEPATGGLLAYVGGRDYAQSQFDRASQARRQPGSAFKPIVYAALFESGKGMPASFVLDSPLEVKLGNKPWAPKNDDGSFHGWVSVRTALERSYNPATARIALQVGMENVVDLAHDFGISGKMDPFPSVALGATEVTPIELTTAFATLAAGGVRPTVHGLGAVIDRYGKAVGGDPLPAPARVLSPESAYLVTTVLEGVFARGTARGAGVGAGLAGKTGTTNDRRDAWFAGYSLDRATTVWVGYDDNSPTRLSGARGALPIWARFIREVTPKHGFAPFRSPAGVSSAWIDPTTGELAGEWCPSRLLESYRRSEVPSELCHRHTGPSDFAPLADDLANPEDGAFRALRRWFDRLFDGSRGGAPSAEPPAEEPAEEAPPPRRMP